MARRKGKSAVVLHRSISQLPVTTDLED